MPYQLISARGSKLQATASAYVVQLLLGQQLARHRTLHPGCFKHLWPAHLQGQRKCGKDEWERYQ